jgi:hypothetical protein
MNEELSISKESYLALRRAAKSGFWGQIQLDYQDGKTVVVRIMETMKVNEDNGNEYQVSNR